MIQPHMLPKARSKLIMSAAAGMPCTARVSSFYFGHRCSGIDTCVMAHLPVGGKGVSTKVSDLAVCIACFNCHQIIDGVDREKRDFIDEKFPAAYGLRLLQAHHETITLLWMKGIIEIPSADVV